MNESFNLLNVIVKCKGELVSASTCVVVVGGVDANNVDRLKIKVLSRFSIVLHRNFRHHKECKS